MTKSNHTPDDMALDQDSYLGMDLLRFTTAGSVDDGKSTLIGRLLYDSKSIFEDHLEAIEKTSRDRGDENMNLALLTDGLKAEREQGITIDVAYRYFATPKRKFIIADTPGHIQYTRNMVTGASTADLAIILIDARKGVVEQTCRHSFIASLLQIKHIIVCINKMDLVDYDQGAFNKIVKEYQAFASRLDVSDIKFIPISALHGDNVVEKSKNMSWYEGGSLLYSLENTYISSDSNHVDSRFPVQWVIRPHSDEHHDFRGFAGRVSSGVFKPGDEVIVLPSGFTSKVKAIYTYEGEISEAYSPMSVAMTLEDEIDISRGDMIAKPDNKPEALQEVEVMICWFDDKKKLEPRSKYVLRHNVSETVCLVKEIRYKVDINTLHKIEDSSELVLNEIGRVILHAQKPLLTDSYKKNRENGGLILIDEQTNNTVAAGIVL